MTPWKKKYLSNLVHPKTVSFLIEKKYLVSHVWCPILRNTKIYVSIHLDHIIRSSFTQYSDIESRSHPPSRIDPQSRIRVPISWSHLVCQEIKDTPRWLFFFGKSGGPECWFHGIWTIHRTMLAMPGDIVDETIISGLHLIRQKTCIHLGLVAWNSWTVVDKPFKLRSKSGLGMSGCWCQSKKWENQLRFIVLTMTESIPHKCTLALMSTPMLNGS
jgi:hypothetical protein